MASEGPFPFNPDDSVAGLFGEGLQVRELADEPVLQQFARRVIAASQPKSHCQKAVVATVRSGSTAEIRRVLLSRTMAGTSPPGHLNQSRRRTKRVNRHPELTSFGGAPAPKVDQDLPSQI